MDLYLSTGLNQLIVCNESLLDFMALLQLFLCMLQYGFLMSFDNEAASPITLDNDNFSHE